MSLKNFIFLTIFVFLIFPVLVFSQDFSKYYGTFTGKFFSKDNPDKEYLINEITITISKPNIVIFTSHKRVPVNESSYSDATCSLEGTLDENLNIKCKGKEELKWTNNNSPSKYPLHVYMICEAKIENNEITGKIFNEKKEDAVSHFIVPLKLSAEKCDIQISVPADVKPGSDFYVILDKTGCVSFYTIYYNGKDKPITKWDGKEVDVEVQVECCDHSAFMKKLKVPAYGSDTKPVEIKQDTGKPTDPKPLEVAGGITAGLLLVKLLQMLTSGRNPNTQTPPPVNPKPPLSPKTPSDTDIKKKQDNKISDVRKTDSDTKNKNVLSPEDKRKKLEEMEKRMEKLREEARSENQTLNSPFGITRDLCKTVPASFNESKDSAKRVYDTSHEVFDKFKEWGDELTVNNTERNRFIDNVSSISGKLKETCANYYRNMEFLDDAKDLKDYFIDKNNELYRDFKKDPAKTIEKYVSTGLGIHHYEKAFDTDRPLEQRLCFLGLGYLNTGTSLSAGTTGTELIKNISAGNTVSLNSMWQIAKLNITHNSILLKEELGKKFPEMYKEAKDTIIREAIIIKAKNTYYNFMGENEKTTLAYNVNTELELINKML